MGTRWRVSGRHLRLAVAAGLWILVVLLLTSHLLDEGGKTDLAADPPEAPGAHGDLPEDSLTCRVLDEDGNPCAGVRVAAWKTSPPGGRPASYLLDALHTPPKDAPAPDAVATTDADGMAPLVGLSHDAWFTLRPLVDPPRVGMLTRKLPFRRHPLSDSEARPPVTLRVEHGTQRQVRAVDASGRGTKAFVRARWAAPPGENWRGAPLVLPWTPTDAAGHVTLPALSAGRASLDVFVPGVGLREWVPAAAPGAGEQLVSLGVAPGARVEGRVRNTQGEPVEGAVVRLGTRMLAASSARGALYRFAVTDAEGRYRVGALPEGHLAGCVVEHAGYVTRHDVGDWRPLQSESSTQLDVRLARACAFVGRVLTSNGTPVAGVRLHSRYSRYGFGRAATLAPPPVPRIESISDDEGRFRVDGLPVTALSIEVLDSAWGLERPLRETGPQVEFASEGEVRSEDLVLVATPTNRIEGRVVDAQGDPVFGASVVWSVSRSSQRGRVVSNPEGRFVIEGSPLSGRLSFAAVKGDLRSPTVAREYGRGGADPTALLELVLRPWCSIEGRVVLPDGSPARDVSVYATPAGGKSRMTRSSTHGTFQFHRLVPGPYTVSARRSGRTKRPVSQSVTLSGVGQRERIELQLPPIVRVAGVLVDEAGRPLAGQRAKLHLNVPSEKRASLYIGTDFRGREPTGADGRFVIELVWPVGARRARVAFEVEGVEHATPIEGPTDNLRIVVPRPTPPERTAYLEGQVWTPDGAELADGSIRVYERRAQQTVVVGRARVTDGVFATRIELVGSEVVVAVEDARDLHGRSVPFGPWLQEPIRPEAGPLAIRLAKGLPARVRVLDPEGVAVAGASVTLRQDNDGEPSLRSAFRRNASGTTDEYGCYETYGFGTGPVRASVHLPDAGPHWADATFDAGEARVDLHPMPSREAETEPETEGRDEAWKHAARLGELVAGADAVVFAEIEPAAHTSLLVREADPLGRYQARVEAFPRAVRDAMRAVLNLHGVDRIVLVTERIIPRAQMQAAVDAYLQDRDRNKFQKVIFGAHRVGGWDDRRGRCTSLRYRDEDHYACRTLERAGRTYTVGYPSTRKVEMPGAVYSDWLYRDAYAEYAMLVGLSDAAAELGLPLFVCTTNERKGVFVPDQQQDGQAVETVRKHVTAGTPLVCLPARHASLGRPRFRLVTMPEAPRSGFGPGLGPGDPGDRGPARGRRAPGPGRGPSRRRRSQSRARYGLE